MTDDDLLRYSDRKREAEGQLVDASDDAPAALRRALEQVTDELQKWRRPAGPFAYYAVVHHFRQHFGLGGDVYPSTGWLRSSATTEDVLDYVEILVEESTKVYSFKDGSSGAAWLDIEVRLNRLFARHRFGYRIQDGHVRHVGSPALDARVVGPALQAVQREGWEEVERSFKEALEHQRGDVHERDDALTAATAALEAALKASGLKGTHLSQLAKSLRNSGMIPSQLEGVPEALDTLLKRSGAIRDPMSDAHGKPPGAEEVPPEIVDLSIYWTGAFINYLAAATVRVQGAP